MVNHLTLESKLMKKTFEKEKNQAGVQVFNYNDTIQFVSNLKDKYPNFQSRSFSSSNWRSF